jgi:hypothetical protein
MSRHRLPVALVLGTILLAVTACGGTSTGTPTAAAPPTSPARPALPAPATVAAAIKSATLSASAVHIKGTITDSGDTTSLDVQLNQDGSASGRIAESDTDITMILVHKVFYLKFTEAMLKANGLTPTSAAGKLLLNKWVSSASKLLAGNDIISGIQPLLGYTTFIPQMVDKLGPITSKAGTPAVIDGIPVAAYNFADGSVADIAVTSPHYLIRLANTASGSGGLLDFTGWNTPVAVAPPPATDLYSGPGA